MTEMNAHQRTLRLSVLIAGGLLFLLVLIGGIRHFTTHDSAIAAVEAVKTRVPTVRVGTAAKVTDARAIALPGTTQAFDSATLFARASGYVAERKVDIGSKVHKGDLLLRIAAPEVDQQLAQARAQLGQMQASLSQAHANADLAAATNKRTQTLVEQGWQSNQQGDQDRLSLVAQRAGVQVAEANLKAQAAQVDRLLQQQEYERVIAPYDGVITLRNVDVGSLVTADISSGTPLLAIAQTGVLRVRVYVPQDAAYGVKPGIETRVQIPELPGREFKGVVARSSDSLQADTRTLLVEVDIDNKDGRLAPGSYCTVRFDVPRDGALIVVPADALIFNRDGLQVAIVQDGHAHLHKVGIQEDDGSKLILSQGLEPGDQVILNPPVDLIEGAPVQVAVNPQAEAP